MPMIRLSTPLSTGGLGDNDYTHVKIVEILGWNVMGNTMTVHAMHGAFDPKTQEFIPARIRANATEKRFVLRSTEYADAVSVVSAGAGEPHGEGFLRAIYDRLLAMPKSPYAGVVVDNLDQAYGEKK